MSVSAQSLEHLQGLHSELQQSHSAEKRRTTDLEAKVKSLDSANLALLGTIQAHKEDRDRALADVSQVRAKLTRCENQLSDMESDLEVSRRQSRNTKASLMMISWYRCACQQRD